MAQSSRRLFGDRRDPAAVLAAAFGVAETAGPPEAALAWARRILEREEIDPARKPVRAIAALRRDRDLGLAPTKWLVEQLGK